MQWKIAAVSLVTWPIAIWLLVHWPGAFSPTPLMIVASLPIFVGMSLDIYARITSDKPDPYKGGSAIGNKIAVLLAVVLICTLLFLAYRVATHQPN